MTALDRPDIGKRLHAQIRDKNDRHDPRCDQGKTNDPENVAGILSRRRPRKTNRREAYDGDQRWLGASLATLFEIIAFAAVTYGVLTVAAMLISGWSRRPATTPLAQTE
jgi:hypothetical protein